MEQPSEDLKVLIREERDHAKTAFVWQSACFFSLWWHNWCILVNQSTMETPISSCYPSMVMGSTVDSTTQWQREQTCKKTQRTMTTASTNILWWQTFLPRIQWAFSVLRSVSTNVQKPKALYLTARQQRKFKSAHRLKISWSRLTL